MFKIDKNQYQFILILEPDDYVRADRHHTLVQYSIKEHLIRESHGVFGILSYRPFEFEILKNRYSVQKSPIKDYIAFLIELSTLYTFMESLSLSPADVKHELISKLYKIWKHRPHLIEPLKQHYDIDFIKYINREINQIDYYFPYEKKQTLETIPTRQKSDASSSILR